jgi:hypothetical protein
MSYTPRADAIPAFKDTRMENKDTQEGTRSMEHDLQELQDAQDEIGWDKFMFGNISILWQEIQAQYFRKIGKENSGLQWTRALIRNIWLVAWDQWEHRNVILYNTNNLVTQSESVMIASRVEMELDTGIQGLLQGDRYLFDYHRVEKSVKWTVDSQVSWLDTVAEARQAYTISLMRPWGLFEGKS